MEYIVPGLCVVLLILGLVAIVMSRAIWRIPQMILVGFILVGSLVFFYMSARTLQTRKNYTVEMNKLDDLIKLIETGKDAKGQVVQKGIEQLTAERIQVESEVAVQHYLRGRVWPGVQRVAKHTANVTITAAIDQPSPHGIKNKMILYVFEEEDKEKGGQYLGQFIVTSDADKQVELTPVSPSLLVTSELNRIAKSKGPYIFYEVMPGDSHELFDKMDEATVKALPKETADEYKRDGTAAKANDPETHVQWRLKFVKDWNWAGDKDVQGLLQALNGKTPAEITAMGIGPDIKDLIDNLKKGPAAEKQFSITAGEVHPFDPKTAKKLIAQGVAVLDKDAPDKGLVYVRPLRDYASQFGELYRRRSELFAQKEELTHQLERVTAAIAGITQDVAAATTEKADLETDLVQFQVERDAVVAFNDACEKMLTDLRGELSKLFKDNVAKEAQLADLQKKLLDEINRRHPPTEANAEVLAPQLK